MSETNDPALDHAMNSLRRWQHAKRMENALREVLKYYDEAGEAGENYELDPDNLSKFADNARFFAHFRIPGLT